MSGNMRRMNKNPPAIAIAANFGEPLRVENDWGHKCIISDHMGGSRFVPDPIDVDSLRLSNSYIKKQSPPSRIQPSAASWTGKETGTETGTKTEGQAPILIDDILGVDSHNHNNHPNHNPHLAGSVVVKPLAMGKGKPSLRLAKGVGQVDNIVSDVELMKVSAQLGMPSVLKKIETVHTAQQLAAIINEKKAPKFVRMTEVPLDTSEEQLRLERSMALEKVSKLRRYKFGISPTHKNIIFGQYIQQQMVDSNPHSPHRHVAVEPKGGGETNNSSADDFKILEIEANEEDEFNIGNLDGIGGDGGISYDYNGGFAGGLQRGNSSAPPSPSSKSGRRRSDSPASSPSGRYLRQGSTNTFLLDDNVAIKAPFPEGSRPQQVLPKSLLKSNNNNNNNNNNNSSESRPGSATLAFSDALPDRDLIIQPANIRLTSFQLLENAPKSAQKAHAGSKKGEKLYDAKEFRKPIPISDDQLLDEKIKAVEEAVRAEEERASLASASSGGGGSGSGGGNKGSRSASRKQAPPAAAVADDAGSHFSSLVDDEAADAHSNYSRSSIRKPGGEVSNKVVSKIKCTHCSNPGTLWCGECTLAFCYVCWGQIPHHQALDVKDFLALEKSNDNNNNNNNYNNSNKNKNLTDNQSTGKSFTGYNETRGNVDLSSLPFRLPKKPYVKHKDYHLNPVILDGKGKVSQLKREYLKPMRNPGRHEIIDDTMDYVEEMDGFALDDEISESAPPPPRSGFGGNRNGGHNDNVSDLDITSIERGNHHSGGGGHLMSRRPLFLKSASLGMLAPGKNLYPAGTINYEGNSNLVEEMDKLVGFSHSTKAKALQDKQIEFKKSARADLPGEERLREIERKRRRKYKKLEKNTTLNRGAIISIGPHGSSCVPPRVLGKDAEFIKVSEANLINLFPAGKEPDRTMKLIKNKVVYFVEVYKEPEVPYVPLKDRVATAPGGITGDGSNLEDNSIVNGDTMPNTSNNNNNNNNVSNNKSGNISRLPTSSHGARPASPSNVAITTTTAAATATATAAAAAPSLSREIATTRAFMEELTDTILDAPPPNVSATSKLNLTVQTSSNRQFNDSLALSDN